MRHKRGMTNEVRECLAEMGVTDAVFEKIRAASNHTDGEKELEAAKEICRRGFRAVAPKYHPDQNQHLPAHEIKAKEDRFKRLRSVHDSFLESRYRGPRRSSTQMGATNFDPFGFYGAASAEDILRNWDNDLITEVLRQRRAQRTAERIQWARDILNRQQRAQKPEPPKPAGPKITPTPLQNGGVWFRDEASCQPQPRKPRKRG